MKFFKDKKGFTLVELVVVIAILGILAGIAVPRFMDATASARGAKIVADLRTIDSAIMMYTAQNGKLPDDTTADDTQLTGASLLASWTKPPSGEAKITNNSGTPITIKEDLAELYLITSGRATYANYTADEIMSSSSKITAAKS